MTAFTQPDLAGGSVSYQFNNASILTSDSDGVVKITNAAGATGKMLIADGTATGHAVNFGQLNAVLDGAPAALNTLNELAAALGDDADFTGTMTTALAEVNQDITDIASWSGLAENSTAFSSFTGATLTTNSTLPALLQELETAVELRATSLNPSFTGTVTATNIKSSGAHQRVGSDTNDFFIDLNGAETLQVTRSSTANTVNYTSHGSTSGIHKFVGSVSSTAVDVAGNITCTGDVDGRDISTDGENIDRSACRHKDLVFGDSGSTGNDAFLGSEMAADTNVLTLQVRVTTAFDSNAVLNIGTGADATYFGSVNATNLSTVGIYEFAVGRHLATATQAVFAITGAPGAGAASAFLIASA